MEAVKRASAELHDALDHLGKLSADHEERISYSTHALNNYLMVVSTTSRLLEKRLKGSLDPEALSLVANLRDASNTMMSTVSGVLAAATTPAGVPRLIFTRVSFGQLIDVACETYRAAAVQKRIALGWSRHRRARESSQDVVLTDRVAAGAVLDNLISNAVKFTPPGEAISVTVAREPNAMVCSVWDRGPGLTEEDRAHLYQRGVLLSARPTGGEVSHGFGLAIARDLTLALGGSLTCASVPGQGACFSFSLPTGTGQRASDTSEPLPS